MSHRIMPVVPVLDDPSNDSDFVAFVTKYTANDSVKIMLARILRVDVSVITQWCGNTGLPDVATREALVRWIQGCPAAAQ